MKLISLQIFGVSKKYRFKGTGKIWILKIPSIFSIVLENTFISRKSNNEFFVV